jgi:hypothetical protein
MTGGFFPTPAAKSSGGGEKLFTKRRENDVERAAGRLILVPIK